MAGHSKWANTKYRKERADRVKGKLFSRLTKELISAVKQGGPDPKVNAKLRLVLQKAKTANLPGDTIERNIKKASSADQGDYTEVVYELYGHGGVGIIVEGMTDNKNRMASDMRIAINKKGGNIANPGAVSFNFTQYGVIQVPQKQYTEEKLFELAIEAGAEEFTVGEEVFLILTAPNELYQVKERLTECGVPCENASLEMIPKNYVECDADARGANLELIDWIEALDDVDAVYHNMKI